MLFEIIDEYQRDKDILRCRIVDYTGVVNAKFDKFVGKL